MFKDRFQVFLKYRFLLFDLISRDIKVKYRRSVLGILWSVLNPLLMMLVISAVFSKLLRFDIPFFPIYYLTGSVIFNFYSESTSMAMQSIISSAALMKKVYIPKYIFPLEKCLFAFVNLLFSLIAVIIMLFILGKPISWTILLFPVPLIYTLIFSIGIGLILSSLSVFFRDIIHLYSVFTIALMYLTPVIYKAEMITSDFIKTILYLNPLTYYVTYFRNLVYDGILPTLNDNLICLGAGLVALLIGMLFFKAKQDKFILYI